MRPLHATLALALAGLTALSPTARADWLETIPDDLALVEPAGLTKRSPVAAEDGAGGAFVGFQTSDRRSPRAGTRPPGTAAARTARGSQRASTCCA